MKLKLQVVLIPTTHGDVSSVTVAARKFLHLTNPQSTLKEVCDELLERYYRLYPDAESLDLEGIQDMDYCDLDPEFTAEDVFASGDILRVLVGNNFPSVSMNNSTVLPAGILDYSSASIKRSEIDHTEAESSRVWKRARTIWGTRASPRPLQTLSLSIAQTPAPEVHQRSRAPYPEDVSSPEALSLVFLPPPRSQHGDAPSLIIPKKRDSPMSANEGSRITSGMLKATPFTRNSLGVTSIFSDSDDSEGEPVHVTFSQFVRPSSSVPFNSARKDINNESESESETVNDLPDDISERDVESDVNYSVIIASSKRNLPDALASNTPGRDSKPTEKAPQAKQNITVLSGKPFQEPPQTQKLFYSNPAATRIVSLPPPKPTSGITPHNTSPMAESIYTTSTPHQSKHTPLTLPASKFGNLDQATIIHETAESGTVGDSGAHPSNLFSNSKTFLQSSLSPQEVFSSKSVSNASIAIKGTGPERHEVNSASLKSTSISNVSIGVYNDVTLSDPVNKSLPSSSEILPQTFMESRSSQQLPSFISSMEKELLPNSHYANTLEVANREKVNNISKDAPLNEVHTDLNSLPENHTRESSRNLIASLVEESPHLHISQNEKHIRLSKPMTVKSPLNLPPRETTPTVALAVFKPIPAKQAVSKQPVDKMPVSQPGVVEGLSKIIPLEPLGSVLSSQSQKPIASKPIASKPVDSEPVVSTSVENVSSSSTTVTTTPADQVSEPVVPKPAVQAPNISISAIFKPDIPKQAVENSNNSKRPVDPKPAVQVLNIDKPVDSKPLVQEPVVSGPAVANSILSKSVVGKSTPELAQPKSLESVKDPKSGTMCSGNAAIASISYVTGAQRADTSHQIASKTNDHTPSKRLAEGHSKENGQSTERHSFNRVALTPATKSGSTSLSTQSNGSSLKKDVVIGMFNNPGGLNVTQRVNKLLNIPPPLPNISEAEMKLNDILKDKQKAATHSFNSGSERLTRSRVSISVVPDLNNDPEVAAAERRERERDKRSKELPPPFGGFASKANISSIYHRLTKLDSRLDKKIAEQFEMSKSVKHEDSIDFQKGYIKNPSQSVVVSSKILSETSFNLSDSLVRSDNPATGHPECELVNVDEENQNAIEDVEREAPTEASKDVDMKRTESLPLGGAAIDSDVEMIVEDDAVDANAESSSESSSEASSEDSDSSGSESESTNAIEASTVMSDSVQKIIEDAAKSVRETLKRVTHDAKMMASEIVVESVDVHRKPELEKEVINGHKVSAPKSPEATLFVDHKVGDTDDSDEISEPETHQFKKTKALQKPVADGVRERSNSGKPSRKVSETFKKFASSIHISSSSSSESESSDEADGQRTSSIVTRPITRRSTRPVLQAGALNQINGAEVIMLDSDSDSASESEMIPLSIISSKPRAATSCNGNQEPSKIAQIFTNTVKSTERVSAGSLKEQKHSSSSSSTSVSHSEPTNPPPIRFYGSKLSVQSEPSISQKCNTSVGTQANWKVSKKDSKANSNVRGGAKSVESSVAKDPKEPVIASQMKKPEIGYTSIFDLPEDKMDQVQTIGSKPTLQHGRNGDNNVSSNKAAEGQIQNVKLSGNALKSKPRVVSGQAKRKIDDVDARAIKKVKGEDINSKSQKHDKRVQEAESLEAHEAKKVTTIGSGAGSLAPRSESTFSKQGASARDLKTATTLKTPEKIAQKTSARITHSPTVIKKNNVVSTAVTSKASDHASKQATVAPDTSSKKLAQSFSIDDKISSSKVKPDNANRSGKVPVAPQSVQNYKGIAVASLKPAKTSVRSSPNIQTFGKSTKSPKSNVTVSRKQAMDHEMNLTVPQTFTTDIAKTVTKPAHNNAMKGVPNNSDSQKGERITAEKQSAGKKIQNSSLPVAVKIKTVSKEQHANKQSNMLTQKGKSSESSSFHSSSDSDSVSSSGSSDSESSSYSESESKSKSESESESDTKSASESKSEKPVTAAVKPVQEVLTAKPMEKVPLPISTATPKLSVARLLSKKRLPSAGKPMPVATPTPFTQKTVAVPSVTKKNASVVTSSPQKKVPIQARTPKRPAPSKFPMINKPSLARLEDLVYKGVPSVTEKLNNGETNSVKKSAIATNISDDSDSDSSSMDSSGSSDSSEDSDSDSDSDHGASGYMSLKDMQKLKPKKGKQKGGFQALMRDVKKG